MGNSIKKEIESRKRESRLPFPVPNFQMSIDELQFEIAVEHFVPWQSVLVQFVHEWIRIGRFQRPFRYIMAPIMAGTPVV